MGSFNKLKKLIASTDKFLLIGHEHPDGDCIGSMVALKEALIDMKKEVDLALKDPVPTPFLFLVTENNIKQDFLVGDYETIILLDNGDLKRTGFYSRLMDLKKSKQKIINIDHHQKNDIWKLADINYINEDASSTSEIVFDLFYGLDVEITAKIATAILTGIFTDTGGFQHSNTSSRVFQVISELMKKGGSLKKIESNVNNSRNASMLKLWGIALERLNFNRKYRILTSVLTKDDIKNSEASEDEVMGLVNLMNSVPEARATLLIYETSSGKIKGSLRTEKDDLNMADLARYLGGGGHKKAAGFALDGKITKVGSGWRIV